MPGGRPTKYDPMSGPSIYGLYDHKGNLIYIGKANDPEKRLSGHIRKSKTGTAPIHQWIRRNGSPFISVIESNCVDWQESERRHIRDARASGVRLLNVTDVGNGSSGDYKLPYPQPIKDALAFSREYSAAMANFGFPKRTISQRIKSMISKAESDGSLDCLSRHFDGALAEWREMRQKEAEIFAARKERVSAHYKGD